MDLIFLWNCSQTNTEKRVLSVLDRFARGCDVIGLNEVYRYRGAVEDWAKENGFHFFGERGPAGDTADSEGEVGSNAVLVKKGKAAMWVPVVERLRWIFMPRRRWHKPRRHIRVALRRGRTEMKGVLLVHSPTLKGNAAAWQETTDTIRKFLKGPGARLVIGDTQRKISADVVAVSKGNHTDHMYGNTGVMFSEFTVLEKYGSDHNALKAGVEKR